MLDNKPDKDINDVFEAFSGRDLMLSSLREKCFHESIKKIIEHDRRKKDYTEWMVLEENFINSIVFRLENCEKNLFL